MSDSNNVLFETTHNIATITLNRPNVYNAFDETLIKQLTNILTELKSDENIRVVLIKAEGKHFSAGADINWMKKMANFSAKENEADAMLLSNLLNKLNTLPKPVIALAQGHTFGGGIGLLACCDIVIATDDAQFCFSEARLGLIPATIAPYVIRKINYSNTLRYFLTCEKFNADQALHMGLVHEITKADDLNNRALSFTKNLDNNGPRALASIKDLLNHLTPIDNITMEYTAKLLAEVRSKNEAQEGLNAFLNKQKPNWINK